MNPRKDASEEKKITPTYAQDCNSEKFLLSAETSNEVSGEPYGEVSRCPARHSARCPHAVRRGVLQPFSIRLVSVSSSCRLFHRPRAIFTCWSKWSDSTWCQIVLYVVLYISYTAYEQIVPTLKERILAYRTGASTLLKF